MNGRLPDVPDLSQAGQVVIREWRVIPVASITAEPGGVGIGPRDLHLTVIDVAGGVAWLIPADKAFAHRLLSALQEAAGIPD